MDFVLYLCLVLLELLVPGQVKGEDVVGCGGFVRSNFPVDFTRIQVKLYGKNGALKYNTDCAPNNGYFLIPLYDKGEFVLKVEAPSGWVIDPSEVLLMVDGTNDQCSRGEDIDFELVGFSVHGQVSSLGLESGPRGVTVSMSEGDEVVQETLTDEDGRFVFRGVSPGRFMITATHAVWNVKKTAVEVLVEHDTMAAPGGLEVLGFDARGRVSSNGEAVAEVQFLLYPQEGVKVECDVTDIPPGPKTVMPGCATTSIPPGPKTVMPGCATTSDGNGEFVFPSLPPGKYSLMPYYRHKQTLFEVHPTEVQFTVHNSSVSIEPSFEVQGFSVSGRVLRSVQGEGVKGAKVYVDGRAVSRTDETGSYQLFNITTGTYIIQVEVAGLQFDFLEVYISPANPSISDIIPARYSVCGSISVPIPPRKSITASLREVQVFTSGKDIKDRVMLTTATTDMNGEFCIMLALGEYLVKAVVSDEESRSGLLLMPPEIHVAMLETPVTSSLKFTQFTTVFTGTVTCIENCPQMTITLSRVLPDSGEQERKLTTKLIPEKKSGRFKFTDVLPGEVIVRLEYDAWCWKENPVNVEIIHSKPHPLMFKQTGYALYYSVEQQGITLSCLHGNETKDVKLKKGTHRLCLEKPGIYTLKPKSCHKFESESYIFKTSSPHQLVLKAVSHAVSAVVKAAKKATDLKLRIRSLRFGKAEQLVEVTKKEVEDGTELCTYHFSFLANPSDELDVAPVSSELMFAPQQRRFTVSGDCPEAVPSFEGSPGVTVDGQVDPPVEGVIITIELEDGERLETTTDSMGRYRAGPIRSGRQYTVSAHLDGYVLEPLTDNPHSFHVLELGHINIQMADGHGHPLSGVLVSLSGANFRSNNFSKEDGRLEYHKLNPGQYFIKPLLREYEFTPASKVVEVREGHSEDIVFTGARVAFSCSGRVMSLNRQPLEGVVVEATSTGEACQSYSEEATSDSKGVYRLRGLLPGCNYSVVVKSDEDNDIDHSLPGSRLVKLKDMDIEGADFLVFYAVQSIYVTGNVVTEQKYLNTLKIHVYNEDDAGPTLQSIGVNALGFFDLPPIPLMKEKHYTLVLESNLSPHFYKFSRVEATVPGHRDSHISLEFSAEVLKVEHDSQKGSIFALLCAVVVVFAIVNIEKIFGWAQGYYFTTMNSQDPAGASASLDNRKRTTRRR